MSLTQVFLGLAAVGIALVFWKVILPKLGNQSGNVVRALVFFGAVGYLAYDFYLKQKYGYIAVLVAGSIAFVLLLDTRKKE